MSLRAVFGFLALAGAGVGIGAGAIAFANTLATHQPPQASDLRRLADMPPPEFPAANAESKGDRLPVELVALAPSDPVVTAAAAQGLPNLAETTARAYAALQTAPDESIKPQSAETLPADKRTIEQHNTGRTVAATTKATRPKPTNVLLNDNQIAALKQRLRLSASQQQLWPEIEAALRGVLHQIYEANRKARGATVPVDTTTPEVERLKTAALPFLMQMRPDQKAEIISLARVIGMEKMVASL